MNTNYLGVSLTCLGIFIFFLPMIDTMSPLSNVVNFHIDHWDDLMMIGIFIGLSGSGFIFYNFLKIDYNKIQKQGSVE